MRTITYWLSLAFIFTIPWEMTLYVGKIGTISKAIGLLFAASWVALIIVGKKPIRKPHIFHLVLLLYVLWNTLSVFWTIDIDATFDRVNTYIQLFGFSYILWDFYTEEDEIRGALQAFVLGLWVVAGILLSLYLAGDTVRSAFYVGGAIDPNNNGVILALGIPFAWYLFTRKQEGYLNNVLKIVNVLYIPAAVFGYLTTASRAAFITSIPALLFVILTMSWLRLRTRVIIFPILVAALLFIQPYVPEAALARLATAPENIASGDLNGRIEIWRAGLLAFYESPVLGVGSHAFRAATDIGKLAHNSFFAVLFELGLVGFSVFSLSIFITIREGLNLPGQSRVFWMTVLVVLGLGIFSLNWTHRKVTWFIPSMVVVHSALVLKKVEDVRMFSRLQEKENPRPTDYLKQKRANL